ncbi:MAG: hypothetical protein MK171_06705 [Pirellulales bacterium]|nr:hypothetical protein [Pirellulales bacterium]
MSQYEFDGDLSNSSSHVDANAVEAPNSTFKEGHVADTAVTGTATFGTGLDGSANAA